jgi:solute carrier family 25 (mitochondrial dicarboxylate transporter), member 10
MQTIPPGKRPSTFRVMQTSITKHGFKSLYAGLTASLMRQMSYSLVRLGAYEKMKTRLSKEGKPSSTKLLLAACLAGGMGGVAGNPAGTSTSRLYSESRRPHDAIDILLVRMTSDVVRPPEQRYNYSNALTGLVNLIRSEGVQGLARGLGTNTVRVAYPRTSDRTLSLVDVVSSCTNEREYRRYS